MVKLSAGEKKKKLIIDTCKVLFYQKGYANTTYEDICEKADIPPGTITYHFGGKRDIATVIDAEYERENKTYIEKMCGDRYNLTQMMVIENFHMWKRIFEVTEIRRFLIDLSSEHVPDISTFETITYFYRCVMKDRNITDISDKELALIVGAQVGMSDGILHAIDGARFEYTYEEAARFGIRFFMRQLGMHDDVIEELIADGKQLFDQLPIDNRYYENFAYDDRYVTKI
ncbi:MULTISPECIES: TetR/AcrR family transcriptional regulator [unclassified Adlercreutzia]|uniref:TetR/AcrR family transcriptional regulator n=1 Tax=unclassified Adlercreutzia TaxID=2636013 RepID=UPI0013EC06DA|nr:MULTISPECIES: TetR/AcrR family transcriptional regulator [unclassified Adlercreutzia]